MMEPTKPQQNKFAALAEVYASVYVEAAPPSGACLWLARCIDGEGRVAQTLFVYADGHTRLDRGGRVAA